MHAEGSGQRCLIASDVSLGDDPEEVIVLFDGNEAVESVLGHQPAYIVDVLVGTCRHEVLGRDLGESTMPADRLTAERPDQVWALDFQFDQASDGGS